LRIRKPMQKELSMSRNYKVSIIFMQTSRGSFEGKKKNNLEFYKMSTYFMVSCSR